ncbi:MAG: 50S ribosomal protein L13 [Candidatus Omnitrophica bacterium]|nr:50S ribosomal protein L13 [Candidatus Omnitrophota bacterium]
MKTYMPTAKDVKEKGGEWYVLDAKDAILGRLATRAAVLLRGKHRPDFTPHMDLGDHVVVINAERVRVTGNKTEDKLYSRYSGFPGGLKQVPFKKMLEQKPTEIIRLAVSRMLPKNRLGRQLVRKLKVYAGPEHPHIAQQPRKVSQ